MKFKKGIALAVAFLMLVSNAGFAMTVHYCEGKISSISSGFDNKETCGMPKAAAEKACCAKKIATSHKKCCSDKTVNLKGKAIDIIAKAQTSDFTAPFLVPVFNTAIITFLPIAETATIPAYYCDANAPPLFKLYHQYILYA
jgi:hypothetical protein